MEEYERLFPVVGEDNGRQDLWNNAFPIGNRGVEGRVLMGRERL
jgi:hypothetical protein